MHKIYSLLRNNNQTGPYTLDELLHLNLKPFDLIWVEGKSGGWSYPSEIDVLKPFITEAKKTIEPTHITTSQSPGNIQPNSEKTIATNTKKEDTCPKAKHIYISMPAGNQITENNINNSKEEETPEAKLERKAQELRNKIQAFAESKNQPKADNELDTKYARSLDDIKEEYSTWLHQQKKKKYKFPKKAVLITSGIAALMIGIYFFAPVFQNKESNQEHILSAEEIKLSVPVLQAGNSNGSFAKKTLTRETESPATSKVKTTKARLAPTKTSLAKRQTHQVDSYLDSLHSAEKTNQSQKETPYEPSYTKEDGSRQRTKGGLETIIDNASEKKPDTAPFEELVKLSESINDNSPHLTLYNNSNKFIKFVAVDAYYYKSNKKLLEKKTFYFNDIPAMSSVKLFVPGEKNAVSVRYEMGLISTNGGLYYAKQ